MLSHAAALAEAFYLLEAREFFRPQGKFPLEQAVLRTLVKRARDLSPDDFPGFGRELVQTISGYCASEERNHEVLYRAFAGLDDVFEIDYRENKEMMPTAARAERLYEGGGRGVQTSYATILKVLARLQLSPGAHLIDLGSGFGRVGLTAGLWREDLRFSGYEYVGHRVAAANASAERAGLSERIRFLEQDLSAPGFEIPAADVYYLYDPFSPETYRHVLARLTKVGRARPITVVAKDAAREAFRQFTSREDWRDPESVDEGSVYLFRSRA